MTCRYCKKESSDISLFATRHGKSIGLCKFCSSQYQKAWKQKNREKYKLGQKKWYEEHGMEYINANREKIKERNRKLRSDNPEKYRSREKKYYDTNKAVAKTMKCRRSKMPEWNAYCALRRAGKLKATPSWANLHEIKVIYKAARELSKATGIRYTVDHIVPLKGMDVCGLHVANNLQIITHSENASKGNRSYPKCQ